MSAAAGRIARGLLGGYFLLMVLFLYAPVVVLVFGVMKSSAGANRYGEAPRST